MCRVAAGGVLAVLCALLLAGGVRAELPQPDTSDLPTDLRVIEANSLLSDPASRDRVIALYREVLSEDPSHRVARMWLARVLSWDGDYDEALTEYREIAMREADPIWVRKESADVLSWAGRYDEAYPLYLEVLELHPDDFELNLALARAYVWGGKSANARKAFERTLEIRDDVVVRDELAALKRSAASGAASGEGLGQFARDSDKSEVWKERTAANYPISDKSRAQGRVGYTRISANPHDASARDRYQAFDWELALRHQFGQSLSAEVGMGARHWDHAEDRFLFRSRLDYTLNSATALGAAVEHGDFLDATASIDVVDHGISYTSLATSCWRSLGGNASAFGILTTTFVSDGNEAVAVHLNSSAKPWADHSLQLSLSANSVSYTGNSDHYYDPDLDIGADLGISARFPETGSIYARAGAAVGFGYAKQDGVKGSGLTYRVEMGSRAEAWGWWIDLSGHRSESQRSTVYTTHGALLRVGRSF